MAGEFLLYPFLDADQENSDAQVAGGQQRAFDFGARRMISPHSIDGDGGHQLHPESE
jgi:hypothetical protein